MFKGQFYVYSILRHLLWNGMIFYYMYWYWVIHMTHGGPILVWPHKKCRIRQNKNIDQPALMHRFVHAFIVCK